MTRFVVFAVTCLLVICCLPGVAFGSELTDQEKQNKALLEMVFTEGVNGQDLAVFDSALAVDYVRHCDAMPPGMRELVGPEMMKGFLTEHFAAFPDWDEQITQMVCQDDLIAIITIGTGTMTGDFGPFKATGRKIKITNIAQHRFKDGKIAETWITWDNLFFMEQAGLAPPPAAPSAPEGTEGN